MKNLEFRFLSNNEKDLIVSLRQECYQAYYKNKVNVEGLKWNWTDENSTHLAFLNQDKVVSCLRLSLYQSADLLESATLFTTPKHLEFPIAMLGRAATSKVFSSQHLHSHLRVFALETCLQKNISSVLGSLEERSPRLQSLKRFGYQTLARQDSWPESCLTSTGPVVLIGLNSLKEIQNTVSQMRRRYNITTSPKESPPLSFL